MKNKLSQGAILCICIALLGTLCLAAAITIHVSTPAQEIAEPEAVPEIIEATDTVAVEPIEEAAEPEVDAAENEMLACVIYQEAGADTICDLCRLRCGDIALTRVLDDRFPNTLEAVLLQRGQFGRYFWTGIVWPTRASLAAEAHAVQRAYDAAYSLQTGTHSDLWGEGYIWMAEFPQGEDVIYHCGIYFGR